MTLALSGIGVSRGIAIGRVHFLDDNLPEVVEYSIPADKLEEEVARFHRAVAVAQDELKGIRDTVPTSAPADITAFIDTYLLMLRDSTLSEVPVQLIRSQRCNAEWALKIQRDTVIKVFDEMADTYLRSRKHDVDHVVARIQRILLNEANQTSLPEDGRLKGQVLVAHDLTPADTVLMQHQGIAAFVTESGGPLSHTAILARSLGIPAVVGIHHARQYLRDDESVVVDGRQGVVLADVDTSTLEHYRQRQRDEQVYRESLALLKEEPAITLDGLTVSLQANIELPDDLRMVRETGASGVGLYRTEFLYMNRADTPDEEEHLAAYLKVIHTLEGAPITIRTLDLGADKQVDGGRLDTPTATNPALGLRAIRLCLKDASLFRPQLRAILRASAHGPLRIMIPMLSSTHELFQVLRIIDEIKRELGREGKAYDPNIPVGGMVEVPAAAIAAPFFAQHLDFLSIGTNDLIQYTLAIDRVDDGVNYLYDPLHPAVLRLIDMSIKAAQEANIPVAMCGEMAGDIQYTRLLLGLGLTEFSMHPSALLEVKRVIKDTRADAVHGLARRILESRSTQEIATLMESLNGA